MSIVREGDPLPTPREVHVGRELRPERLVPPPTPYMTSLLERYAADMRFHAGPAFHCVPISGPHYAPDGKQPAFASASYPAGVATANPCVGDFILTHTNGFFGQLIRFGQRIRYRGADRAYCHWNHAAMIVGEHGEISEALPRTGVTPGNLEKYREVEYTLVHVHARSADQEQMLRFTDFMT